MNSGLMDIASFVIGMCLGMVYFGGLWMTVVMLPVVRHRAIVVAFSFIVRAAAVLSALYLLVRWDIRFLLIGALGFVVMRVLIMARLRPGTLWK